MQNPLPVDLVAALELPTAARPWSTARARQWRQATGWLCGANFLPSNAINQLEMWQRETWSPGVIDRELGWAASLGMNSMRVFLHDLVWKADQEGFLERIDEFLGLAQRHGIGVLFVFFDSCWHPFPRLGRQPPPEPHVHNSGWVQSPGVAVLRDAAAFARLEGYVTGVLERFRDDPRVHGWDIWNEPDNPNTASRGSRDLGEQKAAIVAPLLLRAFEWAHAVRPSQPITCGVWHGDYTWEKMGALPRLQVALSDVVSFHLYNDVEATRARIGQLRQFGRPLLCTEYMCRQVPWAKPPGSTFQSVLPMLRAEKVDAFNWGLVAGKSQTQYPWDSWQRCYEAEPQPWFHDVFRPDGRPYDPDETACIRRECALAKPLELSGNA